MRYNLYIYVLAENGKEYHRDYTGDLNKVCFMLESIEELFCDSIGWKGFLTLSIVGRKIGETAKYTEHFNGATVKRACENAINVANMIR